MPPQFSLEYFDPPAALSRHVLVLFHFSTEMEQVEDVQPGALGQLVLFPQGVGSIGFGDRKDPVSSKPYLMSGFSAAAPFSMRGPWNAVGASLSPLGWAALTKAPANAHIDRFFPAAELLGEGIDAFADVIIERYNAEQVDGRAACDALAAWIASRLGKTKHAHEVLIEATITWVGSALNPDLNDLFANLDYSRRQAERLVERYFGLPPAALARKYRSIRSAAMLAQDDLSDSEESAIAMAYYDQPHMIREIREFCGYTPTRLGGEGQPILKTLLQMKNFNRLQEFKAS